MKLYNKILMLAEQLATFDNKSPASFKNLNTLKAELKEIESSNKRELRMMVNEESIKTNLANTIAMVASMRSLIKNNGSTRTYNTTRSKAKRVLSSIAATLQPEIVEEAAPASKEIRKSKVVDFEELRRLKEKLEQRTEEKESDAPTDKQQRLDKLTDNTWQKIHKESAPYKAKLPKVSKNEWKVVKMPIVTNLEPSVDESTWKRMGIKSTLLYPGYYLKDQTILILPASKGEKDLKEALAAIKATSGFDYIVMNEDAFGARGHAGKCYWLLTKQQYNKTQFTVTWIGFAFQASDNPNKQTLIDGYKKEEAAVNKEYAPKIEEATKELEAKLERAETMEASLLKLREVVYLFEQNLEKNPNNKQLITSRREALLKVKQAEKENEKVLAEAEKAEQKLTKLEEERNKTIDKLRKKWQTYVKNARR